MTDPFSTITILSSIQKAVLKWVGARMGITDAPNVVLSDWKTVESADDPRPAWYHWLHVRCTNVQRAGFSKLLRTQTAEGCHVRVGFRRIGEREDPWWDNHPFAGGVDFSYTHDLIVGDRRAFVPLLIEIDHSVPSPIGEAWLEPGVYPTGSRFFGGVIKGLEEGRYDILVEVYRGDTALATAAWEGTVEVGSDGRPIRRSLPPLPSHYVKPVRPGPHPRPRPDLELIYEPTAGKHWLEYDESPLDVRNVGETLAREPAISPLSLHDGTIVFFDMPVGDIHPNERKRVGVHIQQPDGSLLLEGDGLGMVLRGLKNPIAITYRASDATQYEDVFDPVCDVTAGAIRLRRRPKH